MLRNLAATLGRSNAGGIAAAGRRMASGAQQEGPVYRGIVDKLTRGLEPQKLSLLDDSAKHSSHAAMKGIEGGESHFQVSVVSDKFEGLSRVKRHQLVYSLLDEHFKQGLHALNINAKTPAEAQK